MSDSVFIQNFDCLMGCLPEVEVVKKAYTSGEIALYVYSEFDGHPETLLIASCLVPGTPRGFVAIKDFAENRGVLLALARAGLIEEPDFYLKGIPICRVLF